MAISMGWRISPSPQPSPIKGEGVDFQAQDVPVAGSALTTVIPAKAGIQWPKSLITILILYIIRTLDSCPVSSTGDVLSQERRVGLLIVNRLHA